MLYHNWMICLLGHFFTRRVNQKIEDAPEAYRAAKLLPIVNTVLGVIPSCILLCETSLKAIETFLPQHSWRKIRGHFHCEITRGGEFCWVPANYAFSKHICIKIDFLRWLYILVLSIFKFWQCSNQNVGKFKIRHVGPD